MTSDRITFPPFQLDLIAGRLSRGATPIDLPPKAFAVLRFLAERSGQLVTKDDLLAAIWPDVNVTADVLKVTIAEIRKQLILQVTGSVRWESLIRKIAERGTYKYFEIGCGKTLSSFNKKMGLPTLAVEKLSDLEKIASEMEALL